MSSEQPRVDIIAASEFQRRLRLLAKKYPHIRDDIEPILLQLQVGKFVGDQIQGVKYTVFKERIRNSDIPAGKRGGYRLIYQLLSPTVVVLLLIYPKSDQVDVPAQEIVRIIQSLE